MQIKCSKCGGVVTVAGDDQFVACSYCEAALYVHFEGNSIHYVVRPTVSHRIVPAYIQRWLRENDYSETPRVLKVRFAYFPFWFFQTARENRLVPAAAVQFGELGDQKVPGGDLQFFRNDLCYGAEVVAPTVFVSAARERNDGVVPRDEQGGRADLVHCPFFFATYFYGMREYRLVVDAVTGSVAGHERPPRESDDRTRRLALVSAGAFASFFFVNLLIDSWWAMIPADLVTGAIAYALTRSLVEPGGKNAGREGPG